MYTLTQPPSSDRSIRDLPEGYGPREKLRYTPIEQFEDSELFTLLLGRGGPGRRVQQLAQDLTELYSKLEDARSVPSYTELMALPGLGPAKAATVMAGLELGRRAAAPRGRPIHAPEDALPHLHFLGRSDKERFHALYLDSRRRLVRSETVSVGTLDASLVHPREVFRPAIRHGAAAVLVAHNHPSGDPEPSPEDLALTQRLDRAARLLGISLLDHLIICGYDWISLRQRQHEGATPLEMFAA